MGRRDNEPWDFLGLANFGMFLLVVGFIFAVTPGLVDKFSNFFMDFTMEEISPNIFLPLPRSSHPVLYNALYQFSLIFAVLHLPILAGRYIVKDSIRRESDTISSVVFWFGITVIFYMLLVDSIQFRSLYVLFFIVLGISLIVQGIGAFIERSIRRSQPQSSPVYIPPQQASPK